MSNTPPAIRRAYWRWLRWPTLFNVVVLILVIADAPLGLPPGILFPAMMICPVVVWGMAQARLKRLVLEHEYSLCMNCGYLLKGLADVGACPECGQPYTKTGLRSAWDVWLQ